MMHVDDSLARGVGARVDSLAFLTASPLKAMKAEQIAIFGLHNVLLRFVAPEPTQLDKVGGVPNGIRDAWDGLVIEEMRSSRSEVTFGLAVKALVLGGREPKKESARHTV